jgi:hypothetical protein
MLCEGWVHFRVSGPVIQLRATVAEPFPALADGLAAEDMGSTCTNHGTSIGPMVDDVPPWQEHHRVRLPLL